MSNETVIRASRLRHRVVLEQPVYSRDELGGTMVLWQEVTRLWAEVMPLSGGGEAAPRRSLRAFQRYRVSVRTRCGIRADMRLKHKNKILQIRSVSEEQGKVVLGCEEVS